MEKEPCFSSRLGYILAASGSAVGLGNIWRFPYCAAKYGGGMFLIAYVFLLVTFGYSMLIMENALGRMTKKGPIGTYCDICQGKKVTKGGWLKIGGYLNALVPLIILPYYCVIGGWIFKYIFAFIANPVTLFHQSNTIGTGDNAISFSQNYFENFISSTWQPLFFFILFIALLTVVIYAGVQKGVERFNKILMPLLVIMTVIICIYCCLLPNAKIGLAYYLKPNWENFSASTIVQALAQLFFSLSIAMGIMITYGSYMRNEDNLVVNVIHVQLFDTAIAFLAGLMIIPAVVAFNGIAAAENAGPGLVFVVMPQIFAHFPGGRFISVIFFLLVLFAAATSAISLMETNVQTVGQELKCSRSKAIVICLLEVFTAGSITILGYSYLSFIHPLFFIDKYMAMDILDSMDFISSNVIMPVSAIFNTLLVLCVLGLKKISENIKTNYKWPGELLFRVVICVFAIPFLIIVLLHSLRFL